MINEHPKSTLTFRRYQLNLLVESMAKDLEIYLSEERQDGGYKRIINFERMRQHVGISISKYTHTKRIIIDQIL